MLSQLNKKWEETEVVFLPEGLASEMGKIATTPELLRIVDRLLNMRTTAEILATYSCATLLGHPSLAYDKGHEHMLIFADAHSDGIT